MASKATSITISCRCWYASEATSIYHMMVLVWLLRSTFDNNQPMYCWHLIQLVSPFDILLASKVTIITISCTISVPL